MSSVQILMNWLVSEHLFMGHHGFMMDLNGLVDGLLNHVMFWGGIAVVLVRVPFLVFGGSLGSDGGVQVSL